MAENPGPLVERLVAAGEWPNPILLRGIASLGADAVPALVAALRACGSDPEPSPTRGHLLGLLSVLPGDESLPELLALLRAEVAEELLARAVVARGPVAVEPLREMMRSDGVNWFVRGLAAQLALACAGEQAEPVCAEMREMLRDLVARRETLTADERAFAGSLIVDLAHLPDRSAADLLREAVGLTDLIQPRDLERLLRSPPEWTDTLDWLADYRERYDEREL